MLHVWKGGGPYNCLFSPHIFRSRGAVLKEQCLRNPTQEASSVPDLDDEILNFRNLERKSENSHVGGT